jgi:hypothetical protein
MVSTGDMSKRMVSTGDMSKRMVSTGDMSKRMVSTGDVSKRMVSTGDMSKRMVSTGDISKSIMFKCSTTGVTCGAGTAYPSVGAPEVIPGIVWGSCYSIFSLVFCVVFCRSLLVYFCHFSFGNCNLPVLLHRSVLIDYPFGIFKLFL